MPELPEVETIRRSLERHLLGRTITTVRLHRRDVLITPGDPLGGFSRARRTARSRPRSAAPDQVLSGATIDRLSRRGKQLAIIARDQRVLIVQLGMSGQLFVVAAGTTPPSPTHIHAEWVLGPSATGGAGDRLLFRDPRRFGGLRFLPSSEALDQHWSALGPDALAISSDQLAAALAGSQRPIKAALLDQATLAGVGNIYADEALFLSQVHPLTFASALDAPAIARLAEAIRAVLTRGIDAGGSTLRDYLNADLAPGSAQYGFLAYGRGGDPCSRCGLKLATITAAQRTTTFCPVCQPRTRRKTPQGRTRSQGFPQGVIHNPVGASSDHAASTP